MPTIRIQTRIEAPIERCFDLARSIDFHMACMSTSGEEAVGGVTSGLIGLGQEVTWRGRHFGRWQTLTARITEFSPPAHFRDSMVKGAFKFFTHDHVFQSDSGVTMMEDVFEFQSPMGVLGRVANILFLTRYMTKLLSARALQLKFAAETDEWKKYF